MTNPGTSEPEDEFNEPYIDVDEWKGSPTRRYLHGGFRGTQTRFSMHFPPEALYGGRFFQYITPVPDSEHFSEGRSGEEDKITFAIESGAIFVETNGGGDPGAGSTLRTDPTIGAFRANAAVARHVRALARTVYGPHRVHGYAFGGSGGAFRTISGAENTHGVWDGYVPYVIGSPMAIPNCFTVRMHALRVLRDKFDAIIDALEPGGSGKPFETLDPEETEALREVTSMGFPRRSWIGHRTMGMHALAVIYPAVRAMDPTYFEDYWSSPGYLGADRSASVHRDRVQHVSEITELLTASDLLDAKVIVGDSPGESTGAADDAWRGSTKGRTVAVRLSDTPSVDPQAAELLVDNGAATGSRLIITQLIGDVAVLAPGDAPSIDALTAGDRITIDNSGFLALQTYHRHQVPSEDYAAWDQFRLPDGTPRYPQRPTLLGPLFAMGAAGTVQQGTFEGKMIVIESLLDREAYPWQAHWYRKQVEEHLGAGTNDHFRLWVTDNALHGDFTAQEHPNHTVSYLGILQQALRDISAWVEDGTEPSPTTAYSIVDNQMYLPDDATARHGVQPTITLTVDGKERADIKVGDGITLEVRAATPGTGAIIALEWDGAGSGQFETRTIDVPASTVMERREQVFDEPGTYFPTVRVIAHRDGRTDDRFARLQNIGRVRIVVT